MRERWLASTLMNFAQMMAHNAAVLQQEASYAYTSMYQYVLCNGEDFTGRTVLGSPRRDLRFLPQPKACFYNCQLLASFDREKELVYVEGFAAHEKVPIPLHHAWLLDGDDVVDPTWGVPEGEGREYIGCRFDTKTIAKRIVSSRRSVSFLDDFENQWPLLRLGRIA